MHVLSCCHGIYNAWILCIFTLSLSLVSSHNSTVSAVDAIEQQLWMTQIQACTRRHSDSSAKVCERTHTQPLTLTHSHTRVLKYVWGEWWEIIIGQPVFLLLREFELRVWRAKICNAIVKLIVKYDKGIWCVCVCVWSIWCQSNDAHRVLREFKVRRVWEKTMNSLI